MVPHSSHHSRSWAIIGIPGGRGQRVGGESNLPARTGRRHMARIVFHSMAHRGDVYPYVPIAVGAEPAGPRRHLRRPPRVPRRRSRDEPFRCVHSGTDFGPAALDQHGAYLARWGMRMGGAMRPAPLLRRVHDPPPRRAVRGGRRRGGGRRPRVPAPGGVDGQRDVVRAPGRAVDRRRPLPDARSATTRTRRCPGCRTSGRR